MLSGDPDGDGKITPTDAVLTLWALYAEWNRQAEMQMGMMKSMFG
jgi:hypothetical protein